MFIGHFAAGFATKAAAPKASLGIHLAAALWLDLVFPVLMLAGVERVRIAPGITAVSPFDLEYYPWSHSMLMALVWAAGFAGVFYWRRRDARTAAWLAAAVVSHWVLDWISHRPDVPLAPGLEVYVGLGLWNSIAGTLVVELGLFAAGVAAYYVVTRGANTVGHVATAGMVAVLLMLYAGSFSGPPPSETAMAAVGGIGTLVFIAWAAWADRNRTAQP